MKLAIIGIIGKTIKPKDQNTLLSNGLYIIIGPTILTMNIAISYVA